jgi:hypothetical protein
MGNIENEKQGIEQALQTTLEGFTDLINQWNDAAEDGDRGRANNAIALIIWDDGSGRICTYWPGFEGKGEHLNLQMEFDNLNEAIDRLMDWLG